MLNLVGSRSHSLDNFDCPRSELKAIPAGAGSSPRRIHHPDLRGDCGT